MSTTEHGQETHAGSQGRDGDGRERRLEELLVFAAEREATDLHLKPMRPPLLRLRGKLVPTPGEPLGPAELESLILRIVPPSQRAILDEQRRVEFGYSIPGVSRFRAVVYHQRGSLVATFRRLPWELPGFYELGLPPELQRIAGLSKGLVLVSGPHGSGRSTTLAAIVREIADKRLVHVMTLEQPIEYPLRDGMGTVTQLEVGADTPGLPEGVDAALCEDADVVAVDGSLDARERLRLLDAAATDRLVLVTFLAETAADAVNGFLVDIPAQWRRTAALRLAEAFRAAIGLRVLDRADGTGHVPAVEMLWHSDGFARAVSAGKEVRHLVRDAESLDAALARLVRDGAVAPDEALLSAPDPAALERRLAESPPGPAPSEYAVMLDLDVELEDAPPPAAAAEPAAGELERLQHLVDAEERYERLQQRYETLSKQRDSRIEELEQKLEAQQRRGSELARQLEELTEEKAQILEAVEREAVRLEREEQVQRRRLEELEERLRSREVSESRRAEQIEALERERRRTVEMVEAHCREYERRISRLQSRLRQHGIDPLKP